MKITVRSKNILHPHCIAVVSRTDEGCIDWCNHGGEIDLVEITSYSINSAGDDIEDTTEFVQECAKCGARYNELTDRWS